MDTLFTVMNEENKFQPKQDTKIEYVDDLSYRAKIIHNYLKDYCKTHKKDPSHKRILIDNDDLFGYSDERLKKPETPFNDLTCRRNLTEILEELSYSTGTHHVFTGHGYTDKDWKIQRRIKQLRIQGKRSFRKMAICQLKAAQNGQLSYDFNSNKIKKLESKIKKLDIEISSMEEELKEFNKQNKVRKEVH